jgi:hypothetical protein
MVKPALSSTVQSHPQRAISDGVPKMRETVLLAIVLSAGSAAAQTTPTVSCQSLGEQHLTDTTITAAQEVTSGSFTAPNSTNVIGNLPPFCRVVGVIAPTSESQILFELWLPLKSWNGKFAGVGNGGWPARSHTGRSLSNFDADTPQPLPTRATKPRPGSTWRSSPSTSPSS